MTIWVPVQRLSAILVLLVVALGCEPAPPSELPRSAESTVVATSSPSPTQSDVTTSITVPEIALGCPDLVAGGAGGTMVQFEASVGGDMFATAVIDYGDDKSYESTSWADAVRNMFWHRYNDVGRHVVTLLVSFQNGHTAEVSCSFTITAPPPPTAPPAAASTGCDANYIGACVPIATDVDCASGSGNGPAYVRGPVTVVGADIYGLDRDSDGIGCENG